ncbi:glutaredoxin family protein [Marinobacter sp. F3R08]|uniref:glutaredoxin family protein n=1 Tax=Marinobacter sp. F3R08 TaxID=2841559 RepID=UPI001C088B0C|nr:glutaredoxin domain-containing protein [Marinobacter sp. F3R08]MBU2955938.1 glutathione S-transferase N-terminal domain-containing protein [Marinobacter sp. F3R08]
MPSRPQSAVFLLYHYRACPFCAFTRSALKHIDINVEERDIAKEPAYRKELIQGGGKAQVPCLRIDSDGDIQWLYESRDIVRFLQRHAANHH